MITLVNRAEILSEDFLQRIPILGHSIGRIRNCLRHFFAPFLAYDIGGIRASLAPSRAYVIGGIRDVSLQILAPLLAKVQGTNNSSYTMSMSGRCAGVEISEKS